LHYTREHPLDASLSSLYTLKYAYLDHHRSARPSGHHPGSRRRRGHCTIPVSTVWLRTQRKRQLHHRNTEGPTRQQKARVRRRSKTTTTPFPFHINILTLHPPGRRLRPRLQPLRRHPARLLGPHRLRRRKPPIPIRRPSTSRRHLHRRLLHLRQRVPCNRRHDCLVAMQLRAILQPVRRVHWRAVRGDSHSSHFPQDYQFECDDEQCYAECERGECAE
jgi:hypothetical protein